MRAPVLEQAWRYARRRERLLVIAHSGSRGRGEWRGIIGDIIVRIAHLRRSADVTRYRGRAFRREIA